MKKSNTIKRAVAVFVSLATLLAALSFTGCSEKRKYAIKIGDYEITYEFYRYIYMNFRNELIGDGVAEDELDGRTRELSLESLKKTCTLKAIADKYDITVSDEVESYVDDTIEDFKAEYADEEKFEEALKENYLTEKLFRDILVVGELEAFVKNYVVSEENDLIKSDDKTVEEFIRANYYRAVQILIREDGAVDENGNTIDKKALADDLYAKLAAGGDFKAISDEYNQDPSVNDYDDGYYIMPDYEDTVLADAVTGLEIGELYPSVIESDEGYRIIKRMPLDDEYINDNFGILRGEYKSEMYSRFFDGVYNEISVEYSDFYSSLTEDALINDFYASDKK